MNVEQNYRGRTLYPWPLPKITLCDDGNFTLLDDNVWHNNL